MSRLSSATASICWLLLAAACLAASASATSAHPGRKLLGVNSVGSPYSITQPPTPTPHPALSAKTAPPTSASVNANRAVTAVASPRPNPGWRRRPARCTGPRRQQVSAQMPAGLPPATAMVAVHSLKQWLWLDRPPGPSVSARTSPTASVKTRRPEMPPARLLFIMVLVRYAARRSRTFRRRGEQCLQGQGTEHCSIAL